jgi:hypothetical protein
VKALSLAQLDELGEVIFDMADLATLEEWLLAHPVASQMGINVRRKVFMPIVACHISR